VFISEGGMVQRTAVRGISQQGRSATGVRVMNLKDDDRVSAVAVVVESDGPVPAAADDLAPGPLPGPAGDSAGDVTPPAAQ